MSTRKGRPMPKTVVRVVPAEPKRPYGDRQVGRDLEAAVEAVKAKKPGQSYLLAEFRERPRQAYWYRARLAAKFDGREFTFAARIEGGVGKLFCKYGDDSKTKTGG